MYTIVIQAGAILALVLLYLERIVGFLKSFPKGESGDRTWMNHPISLTIIAFVCTSALALPFHKWSERNLGSITVMAWALLLGGIIMWVIDARSARYEPSTLHVEEMSLGQSIWIGLCQSLSAIFPGTLAIHVDHCGGSDGRPRPSFGAGIQLPALDSDHARRHRLGPAQGDPSRQIGHWRPELPIAHVVMNSERWIVLTIGFVVSFIVALGVVEWFLMWVRKHGFAVFAVYRIILGIVLLLVGSKFID